MKTQNKLPVATVLIDNDTQATVGIAARTQTPSGNVMQVQIGPGDVISNIPVMIDYDHHQVHEGESFHVNYYISTLGASVYFDFAIKVPNITIPVGENAVVKCPHLRYECHVNDVGAAFLYEGASFAAASGVTILPIAFERNGTYTPKLQFFSGVTTNAIGTIIDSEYFLVASTPQSKTSSTGTAVNEFVLKNNTNYLFRVLSNSSALKADLNFSWYEDLGV